MKKALARFIGQPIVVDTRSSLVYLGTLAEVDDRCLALTEADVWNAGETPTPKERYIMDSKTSGIKANRDRVYVSLEWVVSFSPLADIKEFRNV